MAVEMDVPEAHIGFVVGKQGCTIKNMKDLASSIACHIQFDSEKEKPWGRPDFRRGRLVIAGPNTDAVRLLQTQLAELTRLDCSPTEKLTDAEYTNLRKTRDRCGVAGGKAPGDAGATGQSEVHLPFCRTFPPPARNPQRASLHVAGLLLFVEYTLGVWLATVRSRGVCP